jgi:outer membrane protein OmpA-like peptidoglycan-associated protein
MKKFLMVLAFAGVSVAGMAQNETPELKYSVATNSFWSNWFISADLAFTSFYSYDEKARNLDLSQSPFKDFRRNMGFSVAVGKWFTPGIGLRTKFNGAWGRYVQGTDASENAMKYWTLQEQVLFNLSNLFCGYSETRVWNLIPYAGVGFFRNMDLNEYSHCGSLGLLNTWKLSKHVSLNFDLSFNIADDDIRGNRTSSGKYGIGGIGYTDDWYNAEIGLTFNLGKATWNKVPDVDAIKALSESQIEALQSQLSNEQEENANLKRMLDDARNQKPTNTNAQIKYVDRVVAAPVSVFFNIGKSKIASRKDLVNVQNLADNAKENNSKIVVTGYADSKTGTASLNQKLSEKRAETVANELVKMGVDRNNIEVVAAGGVDTLSPISYNRRAVVEIKK